MSFGFRKTNTVNNWSMAVFRVRPFGSSAKNRNYEKNGFVTGIGRFHFGTTCLKLSGVSLEPEEMLFEENTLETAMYLILSGDLLVFKGVKQIAY